MPTLLNAATQIGPGNSFSKPSVPGSQPLIFFQASGIVSTGTGAVAVAVQVSNDNVRWTTVRTIYLTLGTAEVSDGFMNYIAGSFIRGLVDSISGTNASVTLTAEV